MGVISIIVRFFSIENVIVLGKVFGLFVIVRFVLLVIIFFIVFVVLLVVSLIFIDGCFVWK